MTKEKQPNGRPPHKPTDATRQAIQLHAMVGTRHDILCEIMDVSLPTLYKYYKKELDTARDMANATIAGSLYKKALSGDTASMIFWMKTRARWRETLDISNEDGSLRPEATQAAVLAILAKRHDAE